jgi:hypothetical protein
MGHKMDFRLSEPTVVRVLAPVHRHLEYELILNENHGPYASSQLQEGVIEEHHTGIFAQLAPGDYHIKLAFTSDAALLQAPCQTVDIEMAFMTVKNAKIAQVDHSHVSRPLAKDTFKDSDMPSMLATGSAILIFRPNGIGVMPVQQNNGRYNAVQID